MTNIDWRKMNPQAGLRDDLTVDSAMQRMSWKTAEIGHQTRTMCKGNLKCKNPDLTIPV